MENGFILHNGFDLAHGLKLEAYTAAQGDHNY